MTYLSHAHLKQGAKPRQIKALKRELEDFGCKVHLHYGARRIDVRLDQALERWILLGGFAAVLAQYTDSVEWRPNFTVEDNAPHLHDRSKRSHDSHHL